jgi:hypothetical protein
MFVTLRSRPIVNLLPGSYLESSNQEMVGEATERERASVPLLYFLAPWALVLAGSLQLKRRIAEAQGGGYDHLAELLQLGTAAC